MHRCSTSSSRSGLTIYINKQRGVDVKSRGPNRTHNVLLRTHRNLRMILCNISRLETFLRGYQARAEKKSSSKGSLKLWRESAICALKQNCVTIY